MLELSYTWLVGLMPFISIFQLYRGCQFFWCAIGAYHHWCCEFKSHSGRGVQQLHYVIKFLSDLSLQQVCGFLRILRFPPPKKLDHGHNGPCLSHRTSLNDKTLLWPKVKYVKIQNAWFMGLTTINLTSTFNLETGCNKICDDFDHVV
jgi:hypothetical protein